MKYPTHTVRKHYISPLGPMTLAAAEEKLVGIWFDGQKHQPDPSAWQQVTDHPVLRACASQLTEYFTGGRVVFELPLNLESGTPFQQKVWHALLQIPSARTVSYGALSQGLGQASAVRAVAAAVGRNPLTIVVPCHRVVGGNGALTGYAGGLDRKRELLLLEDARPLV
jgi:methylated-DNA-[protein]-cysteine S-methyltransferase